jgi:hypothetical protein
LDPEELAKCITKQDKEGLMTVHPSEYFLRLWGNEKDSNVIANVRNLQQCIHKFNRTCFWVATEICTQPEISKRVAALESCIKMARVCYRLRNYNGAMAILSGLNIVAVSRLKNTWDLVDPKRMKQLNELESFLSPLSNHRLYRATLEGLAAAQHPEPCIPVLSVFIKDLIFINDGNPKFLANTTDMVNLDKLKLIYGSIMKMCELQKTVYEPKELAGISSEVMDHCQRMPVLREDALYKYSCLCEPRPDEGDTLRLREKWMHGSYN